MEQRDHFKEIYWFIVGICSFGAVLSAYAIYRDPGKTDLVLTFWLSTAVAAGVGYLIGNSVNQNNKKPPQANPEGTTTVVDFQATQTVPETK